MISRLRAASMLCVLFCVTFVVAGCGSDSDPSPTPPSAPYSQTDLVTGSGTEVVNGSRATVAYTGWLYDPTRTDGKGTQFDSFSGYTFTVGAKQVIAGWDQGVPGMRVGGQRRLVIPAELAYGSQRNGQIPGGSTLVFDITLQAVQ